MASQQMIEWATPERGWEVLRQCEMNGINAWQSSHTERTLSGLERHREQGGTLQWILLSHADIENDHRLIKEVAKLQRAAIGPRDVPCELARDDAAGRIA